MKDNNYEYLICSFADHIYRNTSFIMVALAASLVLAGDVTRSVGWYI